MRRLLLSLWFVWVASFAAAAEEWQPSHTWVFAVGILRFDNPTLPTWPDAGRVDAVMLDAFRARGVPEDHIVFLKNEQATKVKIDGSLSELLHRSQRGDTFVFYYAGHGGRNYRDPARPVNFVTYDTGTRWSVRSIVDAIDAGFHGARVLLTADCCHSGALADAVAGRAGDISYAVLTSARPSSRSTGNWTFTQTLVDLLRGNPALDLNGDGSVTLAEAGSYCDSEMAFAEDQRATFSTSNGFPAEWVVTPTVANKQNRVGERCEARADGKWWKAKIVANVDGRWLVRWIGSDAQSDSAVEESQLRPYRPELLAEGTAVEIRWDNKWYPGRVVRTELGLHLVHYDGYPAIDDEWVPLHNLRAIP